MQDIGRAQKEHLLSALTPPAALKERSLEAMYYTLLPTSVIDALNEWEDMIHML